LTLEFNKFGGEILPLKVSKLAQPSVDRNIDRFSPREGPRHETDAQYFGRRLGNCRARHVTAAPRLMGFSPWPRTIFMKV
jgi:hypothetical protein